MVSITWTVLNLASNSDKRIYEARERIPLSGNDNNIINSHFSAESRG